MVTALQVVRTDTFAWPTMLAVIVVLGGLACGGDTKARSGTRSPGGVAQLRIVATTVLSARMRDLTVASPALGGTLKAHVTAGFGPFVVLLGTDGADEADDGVAAGEHAHDIGPPAYRLVQAFLGLLLQI